MKALRYALYAVGALAALVLAAALAAALLIDVNKFKPQIEALAKEATQRTLKLEGDLGLAFFPSLGVSLGRAKLSERASDREFASVESGRIAVALLPLLLRGEAVVDEVRVAGLRAALVRGKDGRMNIDDLLAAKPAKPAPQAAPLAPAHAAPPLRFDISGLRIERASLGYRDERSRQEIAVDQLELRTGRIANDVPGPMRLSARVRGENPSVHAKIEISADYRFDLERQSLALSALEAKASGDAMGISGLSVQIKGSLAARAAKPALAASGLTVGAKGSLGEDAFEAALSVPRLSLEDDRLSGEPASVDLTLRGARRTAEARIRLAGVEGSTRAISVSSLSVEFDARAGEAAAKGSLATPVRADAATGVYELPKIAASIAATSPALPQKTLTVAIAGSVRADLTKETVTAELTTKLDDSSVQAKFGLARFAAPHYTFDLNVDRLDVDRYFPPEPGPATGQAAPSGPGAPADTPIDLSALKGLSVDGRVRIGALTARKIQLAKIRAPLRVANGRLEMSPHEASLYGGSIAGALALDSGSNRVALKETLQGVAVGPLARDLLGRDLIEGRGDIALDVAAAGASVNAMKKSLAGSARVSFADGAVKGINLAEALRKAKAALGSKSAQQQLADKSQKTDFSELKASFVIKDGVAHNEDLTLKSPFFRIAGAGDVDVGASAIDYKVRASIVATAKGQGGVDLSDIAGLTIPIRIAGPFDALNFELDYGAALRERAKSRIGERLGGGQAPGGAGAAPLEDRAKDKLRKLFRR